MKMLDIADAKRGAEPVGEDFGVADEWPSPTLRARVWRAMLAVNAALWAGLLYWAIEGLG